MQDTAENFDIIVIGGGPAGLTAALYAARAKFKTIILDKSPTAGALAYASKVENYPGLAKPISGAKLLDRMRTQALGFGAEYIKSQVVGVNLTGDVKEVITMGKKYEGNTVIIASGSMGRKPSIKGEAEFVGKGVSYCAICDAAFFKGRKVCIIGNSEEAITEAGVLARFAETVYLISPTTKLKVDNHSSLTLPNIQVLLGYTLTAIEGKEVVEKIKMLDTEKRKVEMDVSGVFVYLHGNKPIIDFLAGSLETKEDGCICVNSMMETSLPGVFAAGDVTCKEVRQIIVAASQGCMAALSAEKYMCKRNICRIDWSKG